MDEKKEEQRIPDPEQEAAPASDAAPDFWTKFKRGAAKIGEKISSVVSSAAESTVTAITDAVKKIQHGAKADELFETAATAFTTGDGIVIYALYDADSESLIVREKEEIRACAAFQGKEVTYIVLREEEKKPFPYLIAKDGKETTVSCYKVPVITAYSEKLNPFKQVLIYNSFLSLTPIVEGYQPTFFKRARYADLKRDYAAYKNVVFCGENDEKLYASLAENMTKLIPDGMTALSSIHLQLI